MTGMISINDIKSMTRAVNELAPVFAGRKFIPHNTGTRMDPRIDAALVEKYNSRVRTAIDRALECMESKHLVFNVVDGYPDVLRTSPEGYEYICKRIKHPDTPNRERRDLLQAKRIYELFSEMRRVSELIECGDERKAIKIMSGRR